MIDRVEISKSVQKQLVKIPKHVLSKMRFWIYTVETEGLENTKKQKGYHDELLQGRLKNLHSIRLSKGYRAIYSIQVKGQEKTIFIKEVNKY